MPKTVRKKSESGIYHVVLRGINKQTIFYDDEDREVFLNRVKIAKEKILFDVYGFCLMTNHIHLLIRETAGELGKIFMSLLSSYVLWYNCKYQRVGNLFQDRYRSEGIDGDAQLLCCLRYIHQNPLKAGMVKSIDEYKWSSHSSYINEQKSFLNTTYILSILGGIKEYIKFVKEKEDRQFIEDSNRVTITDEELLEKIKQIMAVKRINNLLQCGRKEMETVISIVRQNIKGASIRQISRVTGVSVNIVRHIQ